MSEDIELLRQETGTSVVAQAAAGSATDEHQKIFEFCSCVGNRNREHQQVAEPADVWEEGSG